MEMDFHWNGLDSPQDLPSNKLGSNAWNSSMNPTGDLTSDPNPALDLDPNTNPSANLDLDPNTSIDPGIPT